MSYIIFQTFGMFENPWYKQLYFQVFTEEGEKDNLVLYNTFVCGFLCDRRLFFFSPLQYI